MFLDVEAPNYTKVDVEGKLPIDNLENFRWKKPLN